jgi:protein-disulfide isomerase-like protein with CxxC motif
MHDDYWTERIKEEIPEEKRQSRRISERFGLDPKVATRLLKRIMLDRVLALRFREQAMSYAEIAEELGVPANRVATVCRTEESRLERARDRKDALLRVQKLHMEEMPEDEIIAEVELPAKTIKTALGKLLRSAQEFERMLPSVKPRVP